MKRILIFLFVLLGIMISVEGRGKTLRKLYYTFPLESDLMLRHLVKTDTATLLYVKVNRAHWGEWSISPELHLVADGRKLAYRSGVFLVKKGKGVEERPFSPGTKNPLVCDTINGECVYPNDSLLLCFDPLPANAETFDFIEGGSRPCIVLGVKCDGKPYPSLLPRRVSRSSMNDLPTYVPRYAKAVLRGRIHGYRKEMGAFRYIPGEEYSVTGERTPFKSWSDSLGNFQYEGEISYPVWLSLYVCGIECQKVLLVPGEELVMDIDMPAICSNGPFSSNLLGLKGQPPVVRFQGKYAALNEASWSFARRWDWLVVPSSFETPFPSYTNQVWKRYQNDLKETDADRSITNTQKEFRRLLAQRSYLRSIVDYMKILRARLRWSRQGTDSLLLKERELEFTLVDPHAHELDLFDNRSVQFALSDTSMIGYMEANGLTDSPFYKWSLDLRHAQKLIGRISRMQPVRDESVWEGIASEYVEPLKQFNDTVVKKLEAINLSSKAGRVHEAPSVASDQLLPEIAAQFKGKVVFFDCWATWCGPCCRGIEQMEPMKKELEGKEIVFVYLTNETSEVKDWASYLERIPGEHYRIPTAVWKDIPGVVAIPQYFIYDRTGQQIFAQRGWNDRMLPIFRETLLKALEE